MVVVSNFEKIEDQDQGYDESDCVDLFCCAVVSISLDNKRIRLSVDWDKPVKYNNTNSEFGLGIVGYLMHPQILQILKVLGCW